MKLAPACSYKLLNPVCMISCVVFLRILLCRLDVVAAFLREVEFRKVSRDRKSVLRGCDFQPQQRLYLCDNLALILSYRMTQVSQSIFISIPEWTYLLFAENRERGQGVENRGHGIRETCWQAKP
jgi:hypothetical protein